MSDPNLGASRRVRLPPSARVSDGADHDQHLAFGPDFDFHVRRDGTPDFAGTERAQPQSSFPDTGGETVTVIVPAFNAEATLQSTLDSVRNQTHAALDILVVNDGSSDATHELARKVARLDPRVRVVDQPNGGVAAARNAGLAAARGAYVAPIDADDLWHPRKIELQLAAARCAGDALGFVYCWSRRIDERDLVLADLGAPRLRGDVFRDLIVSNFIRNASAALSSTNRIRDIGGFDSRLRAAGAQGAEDLKLYLLLAETGVVEVVPAFLVGYRTTHASMSRGALCMRRSIELVISEVAERRPDVPEALFDLAELNFDLYAADIALQEKDLLSFMGLMQKALRSDVVMTARLLAAAVRDRAAFRIARKRPCARFLELDPEQSILPTRTSNRVDDVLASATRRALFRADTPGR